MPRRKKPAARTRAPRARSYAKAETGARGTLVYIHGIGAHPPPDELKLEWDLALFGRDLGTTSRMAYWADLLHPGGPEKSTAAIVRESTASDIDLDRTLKRAGVSPKDEDAAQLAASLLAEVGGPVTAVASIGKRVLPLPPFLRRPVSRLFLEAFIGDIAAYFFRPEIREEARSRLIDALADAPRPVTLVAHSQGSVISYEVLSQMAKDDLALTEFVTLGSPLGITEVQDYLEPPGLEVPPVVRAARWHNFADPLDPVALDKGLANEFEPRGFIQDYLVLNAQSRRLMDFNPHSAVGYLAHPKVREVVNEAMRLDTMGRFVLARDVAERLAAMPEERHPVLIELLEPGYPAMDETPDEMQQRETRELAAMRKRDGGGALLLRDRIDRAARELEKMVADKEAARVDPLQRFVAAHLTAGELRKVAAAHQEMRVYAVWQSSRKAKLTSRSMQPIKADAAFTSFGADGRDIIWAVLDTGVQANHPHFTHGGTIRQVWDCTRRGPPVPIATPQDPDGHGTHVSGIIAGCAPPKLARHERGVAPRAKLVVYKVLNDKGEGEDAWIIKALDHIAKQNENHSEGLAVHGLNLSLGGPFDATVYGCGFSPICVELRRLWRAGVVVVVACGNEGQLAVDTPDGSYDIYATMSIGDPANLEDCIAVGSVNADKPHLFGISSFSSRGPTADGRAKPDVVAPGERISSCNARFRGDRDLYYRESGTSMAAPHVSGLIAAFLSVRREFRGRPDEVKRALLAAASDLGRDRYHQGAGMPNLMQMLLDA